MFPKQQRIAKNKEFSAAIRSRTGFQEGKIALKTKKREGKGVRAGIVISKKVEKLATKRNRMRRLLREAIRQYLPRVQEGWDLVFLVLPGIELTELKDALPVIKKLLQRSSLLKAA
ncbi:MAG: ribonuclease P protein component [Candidatus Wildermuthbacteria bacterium]|nr:ribonuclease P protein component [Candidatus Wildermuthbacteria bacterium]